MGFPALYLERGMVRLILTECQARNLERILYDTTDEGPLHEGWASSELSELRDIVSSGIFESTSGEPDPSGTRGEDEPEGMRA